jgi:hypothetical protein
MLEKDSGGHRGHGDSPLPGTLRISMRRLIASEFVTPDAL